MNTTPLLKRREVNPRETANFLSKIFFKYTLKLLKKGFRNGINEDDLFEVISGYKSNDLGNKFEKKWSNSKVKSLYSPLWRLYGVPYIILSLTQIIQILVGSVLIPFLIGKIVACYASDGQNISKNYVTLYLVLLISTTLIKNICEENYKVLSNGLALKIVVAISSFMYRRILKMKYFQVDRISLGEITTILTVDTYTLKLALSTGSRLMYDVVKLIVVAITIIIKVGYPGLIYLLIYIAFGLIQFLLGKKSVDAVLRKSRATDRRIQEANTIFTAIKTIKMYMWEEFFKRRIEVIRRLEANAWFEIYILHHFKIFIGALTYNISILIVILISTFYWDGITAENIFFMLSSIHTISVPLILKIPLFTLLTSRLLSSMKRINEAFTVISSLQTEPSRLLKKSSNDTSSKITLKNVILYDLKSEINVTITRGLTAITGANGSGKSYLLKAIINDSKPKSGDLFVNGTISYVPQDPWLCPSTIKDNIVLSDKIDESRYELVLRMCDLQYDLQMMPNGDETILADNGINLSRGQQARVNLARALYKNADIYLIDDCMSCLDVTVADFIFKEAIKTFLDGKIVIMVTSNPMYLKNASNCINLDRNDLVTELNSSLDSIIESPTKQNLEDVNEILPEPFNDNFRIYTEEKLNGAIPCRVYCKYINYGGKFLLLLTIGLFIIAQIADTYQEKLISQWINFEESVQNSNYSQLPNDETSKRKQFLWYYLISMIVFVVTVLLRGFSAETFNRFAAIKIHSNLIQKLLNSCLEFYYKHFLGNILNRMNTDIWALDRNTPVSTIFLLTLNLQLLGSLGLIILYHSNLIFPTILFGITLYILKICYMRTVRNLRRLRCSTRGAVVDTTMSALKGLLIIQVFNSEDKFIKEFDNHQDLYTSASFMDFTYLEAFAFGTDITCLIFITFVLIKSLYFGPHPTSGEIGLVLAQSFRIGAEINITIREIAEFEANMTSFERLDEYQNIRQENKTGLLLENDWPKMGKITFENLSLSYTKTNYALHKLSFHVKAGEKFGIVGRTGSGKSSIISCLFRLFDYEGRILIDGIDIKMLSIEYLRSKISVIPQDKLVFTGTIRENLDPFNKHPDSKLAWALRKTNLVQRFAKLDQMVSGIDDFSAGELQRLYLARILIQNNKIVIFDEAGENLDHESEISLRKLVERDLNPCTLIIIAHNLNLAMNCDKVLVLQNGKIVECGKTSDLVDNIDGYFYKMAKLANLL